MISHQDVLDTLKESSRTFFIPISRLPHGLQEAVASAYLCMRLSKIRHLTTIGQLLQAQTSVATFALDDFSAVMRTQQHVLPEVTIRIGEWACLAPEAIAPRIWDATATMAERMAHWVADGSHARYPVWPWAPGGQYAAQS